MSRQHRLQQICVSNQLASCTPNRQAVPAYHSYRDGDYTVDCWGELLDYDFVDYGHECVDLGAGRKPTCAFSEEACAPEGATRCALSSDGQRSGYLICRGQLWAEEILCPTGCLDDTSGAHCL
jgi:hypothetical protein